MTISRLLIGIAAFTLSSPVFSQLAKTFEIEARATFFSTDDHCNIYYVDHDSLVKLVPPYHHYFTYHFGFHGTPDYIDTSNPTQIICLYRNSQRVALLDSSLKIMLRPFYLDELGMYDIYAMASTEDQGLWLYNIYANSLVKLNKNFMLVVKSVSLDRFFSQPHLPTFMTEYRSRLYIDVPGTGIFVLDQYGNFKTAYHLPSIPDFQIVEDALYYYRDNIITEINLNDLKSTDIQLPVDKNVVNAHFHHDTLIIQTPDHIAVYTKPAGSQ